MGHRFSKTAANNIATTATATGGESNLQQQQSYSSNTTLPLTIPTTNGINHFVGPTINLQIQEETAKASATTCCHTTATTTATATSPPPSTTVGANSNLHSSSVVPIGGSSGSSNCSSSLTSVNNLSCGRQIIIKIQLAKMENGNDLQQQQQHESSLENVTADCNRNSTEMSATTTNGGAAQILNFTLNSSSSSSNNSSGNGHNCTSSNTVRTAGSSQSSSLSTNNNNYLNPSGSNISTNFTTAADALSERLGRMNTLQFNDEIVEQNIGEIVEYCEVLEGGEQQQLPIPPVPPPTTSGGSGGGTHLKPEEPEIETNACCRRKSKSLAANGGSNSANAKRRCRKCSCRDAFRRILDPSLSRSSNKAQKQQQQQQQLERKEQNAKLNKANDRHSISNPLNRNLNPSSIAANIMPQRNSIHSTLVVPTPSGATAAAMMAAAAAASQSSSSAAATNQLAVWAPVTATATTNGSDVIIPLTTPPQFVVVQCAIVNPPLDASHQSTNCSANGLMSPQPNSIISITHNNATTATCSSSASNNDNSMVRVPVQQNPATNPNSSTLMTRSSIPHCSVNGSTSMGPIVHSQVDFVHYLVPDLERITNSSFYWGKMDRYEAERLLEGKPEGTFLLRDSAQEEFLFSVTFRKYGRSLHARIEQSGHQFSFDCHDPCVFTAPTVTGLLEHYKDPACVMFFEPMLTIPLHRKSCFSLQKLCRATIVSNTTYDGINELELPTRLKSYLKEYHYKQKLRVKSNEPTYTIHCK